MTPDEKQRMAALVQQIQVEQDQKKFTELVTELNALLARKDKRLDLNRPPR
jgi:hypothetical protein